MDNDYQLNPRPHDDIAEKTLLTAILTDKEALETAMMRGLSAESFYDESHKALFGIVKELYINKLTVDYAAVSAKLNTEKDKLTKEVFLKLINNDVPISETERLVLYLKQLVIRRDISKHCEEIRKKACTTSESVDEILALMQKGYTALMEKTVIDASKDALTIVNECIDKVQTLKFETGPTGIMSGLPSLDAITLGWQKPDSIIIAARPSVGKSAFSLYVALNAIRSGHKVGIFSLEMSDVQIGNRILSSKTGIPGDMLRNEMNLSDSAWNQLMACKQQTELQNLIIDDTGGLTSADFAAKARRMVSCEGVDLIIVDYLQLMRPSTKNNSNREQDVAEISRTIKSTAKSLDIPIIALSQLSRQASPDMPPKLSDLRESGAIEQDADIVILMSRVCPMDSENRLHIEVAKNRNGRVGIVLVQSKHNEFP